MAAMKAAKDILRIRDIETILHVVRTRRELNLRLTRS